MDLAVAQQALTTNYAHYTSVSIGGDTTVSRSGTQVYEEVSHDYTAMRRKSVRKSLRLCLLFNLSGGAMLLMAGVFSLT